MEREKLLCSSKSAKVKQNKSLGRRSPPKKSGGTAFPPPNTLLGIWACKSRHCKN